MKNVLVIGSPNSIHTMNFINTILLSALETNKITVFSTLSNTQINDEFIDFYKKNNIKIIGNDTFSKNKLPKIRSAATMFLKTNLLIKHLKQVKHYDYCFVLYLNWQAAEWVGLTKKYFSHIISVFWGGDVLRNKQLSAKRFTKCLAASEHIVLPNINASQVFSSKTNCAFDKKVQTIQYPQKMVSSFLTAELSFNKEQIRKKFGLPQDKIIVLCGHEATRAEQYEIMIKALNQCKTDTLEMCYFVFMMTYAPEEHKAYQDEIERLVDNGKISGTILRNYIPYADILHLHMACDVHITTILTDAFSCFLQEEMLAGNVLIYGKWLNYYEIENDSFYVFPVDEISDIAEKMDFICENFVEHKEYSAINKQGIIDIASEDAIKKAWKENIFSK